MTTTDIIIAIVSGFAGGVVAPLIFFSWIGRNQRKP